MPSELCDTNVVPTVWIDQKSDAAHYFSCLDLKTKQWCHLWYHLHHIIQHWCQWHRITKKSCLPHFYCLVLINTIFPLTIQSASHDTNTSIKFITWPKMSCCTSFQLSWPKKCNSGVDDTTGITWYWYCCQRHHMTKKSCCALFWSSWYTKCNDTTDDAVGIM